MEPFGLLTFLQTLLSPNAQNAQNTTVNTTTENGQENTEIPPQPSEPFSPATQPQTDNQRAFLGFLDEHEKRARHIKK